MEIGKFKKQLHNCKFYPIKKVEPEIYEERMGAIYVYEINNERYIFKKVIGYLFDYACVTLSSNRKMKVLLNSDNLEFLVKTAIIKYGSVIREYDESDMEWVQKKYKLKEKK